MTKDEAQARYDVLYLEGQSAFVPGQRHHNPRFAAICEDMRKLIDRFPAVENTITNPRREAVSPIEGSFLDA